MKLKSIWSWEFACSRDYKTLEDSGFIPTEWNECPNCKERPRVWLWDHGRQAKCRCQWKHDPAQVRTLGISDFAFKNNQSLEGWDHDELRNKWNNHTNSIL